MLESGRDVETGLPLVDTRVIYCGDNLEQLRKLPDACVDLIYIDPPFNSNRNYEVFWGETKEKRAFEDRHESTQAYIEFMRPALRRTGPRAQEDRQLLLPLRLARLHYVKVMLDQIFGENNFQNEIIWKRQSHSEANWRQRLRRQSTTRSSSTAADDDYTWNRITRRTIRTYIDENDALQVRASTIRTDGGISSDDLDEPESRPRRT